MPRPTLLIWLPIGLRRFREGMWWVMCGFLKSLEGKGLGVEPFYSAAAPALILHLALASSSSSLRPHHITRQLLRHLSNRKLVISHHSSDRRDGAQEKRSSSSRASRELNRAEEWVSSVSNEAALNQLVVDGMLPDRVMTGWHAASGESFPTPTAMNWSCLNIISITDLAF